MDRLKQSKYLLLALVIGGLSGCATGGGYQAYTPQQGETVESIAILAPANPASYTVLNLGSPGMAFGAIGGIFAAADNADKTETLDELLTEADFDFSAELTESLKTALEASGYEVSIVQVEREEPTAKAGKSAELDGVEADAVLDVITQMVGYANESMVDNDFRPDIRVRAELLSASTREPLYGEMIMYGYSNAFMAVTELPAPEDYFFDGAEELFNDVPKATEGLQKGVDTVAAHIAGQLSGT